jgi:hypothetical protein
VKIFANSDGCKKILLFQRAGCGKTFGGSAVLTVRFRALSISGRLSRRRWVVIPQQPHEERTFNSYKRLIEAQKKYGDAASAFLVVPYTYREAA